ncbi:Stk1 family PASTA domain-containing Ser/Thr kinase [Kutzneria sp. CA-103260]|uniref:Stk1 family PASTA domain-containing Ser/Thr kinase n=1 Tax=Kutzneria sp. CA-103260 TaxID=2802641 RepID=UPI001BEE1710|nr:Stk1 family PASTA domain-containing Ser/Thr kinase [Kutzneria sp. CA-103260]QUQ67734.1 serine/threonine protein kinase [Kutzneria sp. CA-103260]
MGTQSANLIGGLLEQRYRVNTLLARGGMSTVYRGVDTRLERPVAIKVMDPRFSDDQSFIDRFVREARTAAQLHHPGVVGVYDQGVDRSPEGDHVFLVMELVDGGTLRDLLRERGALTPALALAVLEGVLSALGAAHRAGLVHRDVKPENVLIGRGGAIKVADFGLVRAMASANTTSDDMILGTVAYLSPEQVATGASDPRSDVYSAGILLYEMLTGQPPYSGDNPISVAYRHVNDDVPPPSEAATGSIPPALDDLVLRATRRDPALRPLDADAFLAEAQRTALGLGITPTPVPMVAASPQPDSTIRVRDDGPPTEKFSPITAATPAPTLMAPPPPPLGQQSMGPMGTRAMSRADLDANAVTARHAPIRDQSPADRYQQQRTKSRRAFIIWMSVIVVLAAAVATAAWWLGTGQWSLVPTVKGLQEQAAEQKIRDANLQFTIKQVGSNDVAPGLVVDVAPGEQQQVQRGSSVTLSVSKGKPTVPNVQPGTDFAAAQKLITDEGLQALQDQSKDNFSDTVPAGKVLTTLPAPGTQVPLNSAVVVVLSKGAAPKKVPSVVGLPHDQAFQVLQQAGFQPVDGPAQFSDQVDKGKVISTSPDAGSSVASDGNKQVTVVVSNAVVVPDLSGMSAEDATNTLKGLGLNIDVQGFFGSKHGKVFSQDTPPGTRVKPGTKITVQVFP